MLDEEADQIAGAARYERSGSRKAFRAGHYERKPDAKAGTLTLKVPKLKGALFESAVVERYRRREESVEEALMDMYLAGAGTRQVDDTGQLLWGERMAPQTLSDKPRKVYADIERWRTRPLDGEYPYVCSWTACGTSGRGAAAWRTRACSSPSAWTPPATGRPAAWPRA